RRRGKTGGLFVRRASTGSHADARTGPLSVALPALCCTLTNARHGRSVEPQLVAIRGVGARPRCLRNVLHGELQTQRAEQISDLLGAGLILLVEEAQLLI